MSVFNDVKFDIWLMLSIKKSQLYVLQFWEIFKSIAFAIAFELLSEAYLEPCQISKKEPFAKKLNSLDIDFFSSQSAPS